MDAATDSRSTILVVDDEPTNIKILGEALSDIYNIVVARSGEEALGIVRQEASPNLILLDVMMPDMNGIEVCQKLQADAATSGIPVIFVTSLDDKINEEVGLKAGAVDYISKPFSLPVVRARVKVHLEHTLYRESLEMLLAQRCAELEAIQKATEQLTAILGR